MFARSTHTKDAEYFNQRNEILLLETQQILEKCFNFWNIKGNKILTLNATQHLKQDYKTCELAH